MKNEAHPPTSDASSDTDHDDYARNEMHEKPKSLTRPISPPSLSRRSLYQTKSATAAVEAGEKQVENHLTFYSERLLLATRPGCSNQRRISHQEWIRLYESNAGSEHGSHFVIHQHDHPAAGTHYDLRLQCNPTSSISFAIMYGLPGDPNSRRLNRNATETRVHCLWNHLVETASESTGSMLIWDTGEYEVLPYHQKKQRNFSDGSNEEDLDDQGESESEQRRLCKSFYQRKLRLRLHGTRLPKGYTISLRLTKENYRDKQPQAPHKRRRQKPTKVIRSVQLSNSDTDSSETAQMPPTQPKASDFDVSTRLQLHLEKPNTMALTTENSSKMLVVVSDDEEMIRENNAYPGAFNDVGSIYQRRWYLSLDRHGSGFVKQHSMTELGTNQVKWVPREASCGTDESSRSDPGGFAGFQVLGRDSERSVLTGRLAKDILEDEGVQFFIPRGLWRPITE